MIEALKWCLVIFALAVIAFYVAGSIIMIVMDILGGYENE